MVLVEHSFPPVWDRNSKILIVGTIPSIISRREGFYYSNPKNRFFNVICALLDLKIPESIDEKKGMLIKNCIAIYDVLKSCYITNSGDSSIRLAKPNDFSEIFNNAKIRNVYANGRAAHKYYEKFIGNAVYLPSTSPANASFSLERLITTWQVILKDL